MEEEIKKELDKIKYQIRRIKLYQDYCIDKMDTYKREQIGTIISLVIVDSTLPVILASFGHIIAAISALTSATTYSAAIYISRFKKIKKTQKKAEEAQNQIDYLEKVKQEIEKEYENTNGKNSNINISYINEKYNWQNKIRLMNIYDEDKKEFVKLYKKGKLIETLKNEYKYDNNDISYLYERTEKEIKNKKKVLKKTFGDYEY